MAVERVDTLAKFGIVLQEFLHNERIGRSGMTVSMLTCLVGKLLCHLSIPIVGPMLNEIRPIARKFIDVNGMVNGVQRRCLAITRVLEEERPNW